MGYENRIELGDADDAELRQLVGEVQERLNRIAALFARVHDEPLSDDAVPMFRTRAAVAGATDAPPTVLIEILDNVAGAGPDGGPGQCCAIIPPHGHSQLACPCSAPPFPVPH